MTSSDLFDPFADKIPRVVRVMVDINGTPVVLLDGDVPEALTEDARDLVQRLCEDIKRERGLTDFMKFTNNDYFVLIRAVKKRLLDHLKLGHLFKTSKGWGFEPESSVIAVDFKKKRRVNE